MLGEDLRRERHEGDAHQKKQVDEEEGPIGFSDERKDDVVVDPHDPDREKTERIGEVGRPKLTEAVSDVATRKLNLEDEQRCGDGEDPVGKGFQPVRRHGATVTPG